MTHQTQSNLTVACQINQNEINIFEVACQDSREYESVNLFMDTKDSTFSICLSKTKDTLKAFDDFRNKSV